MRDPRSAVGLIYGELLNLFDWSQNLGGVAYGAFLLKHYSRSYVDYRLVGLILLRSIIDESCFWQYPYAYLPGRYSPAAESC